MEGRAIVVIGPFRLLHCSARPFKSPALAGLEGTVVFLKTLITHPACNYLLPGFSGVTMVGRGHTRGQTLFTQFEFSSISPLGLRNYPSTHPSINRNKYSNIDESRNGTKVISIILCTHYPTPEFELVGVWSPVACLLAWESLRANYAAATFIPQHTESRLQTALNRTWTHTAHKGSWRQLRRTRWGRRFHKKVFFHQGDT